MTPKLETHLANCFEISATRFPGEDTNGRVAGGDLASRLHQISFQLNGSLLNVLDPIAASQSTEVLYPDQGGEA